MHSPGKEKIRIRKGSHLGTQRTVKARVILYPGKHNGQGERLKTFVEATVPRERIKVCRSPEDVAKAIGGTWKKSRVAVLMASDQEDLDTLIAMGELLREMKLIIILPDGKKETVERGHALHPRFLTFVDGDLGEVAAVLGKML